MPRKLLNSELQRLTPQAFQSAHKLPVVLVLDNIRSQHNIGAAFRSADAFCIERIYLCGISATPPTPEIHKSALGAEEIVPWVYMADTTEAVHLLRKEGYTVLAIEQVEGATLLHQFDPCANAKHPFNPATFTGDPKYALIFGNEVRGIDQEVVDMSDGSIEIPQFGTKHSLNVSVSIGVVLWDFWVKLHG